MTDPHKIYPMRDEDPPREASLLRDCCIWTGYTNKDGYGQRRFKGRPRYVHRIAYCESKGLKLEDIRGICVLHTCDTPACYNPNHLFLGTRGDNCRDRAQKGRCAKGEDNGQAKLTAMQVTEIRRLYSTGVFFQRQLAERFGVSKAQISHIVRHEQRNG